MNYEHPYDFWSTPAETTLDLLRWLRPLIPSPAYILEPCAGDGAMLRPLRQIWPLAHLTAVEIRSEEQQKLSALADLHIEGDFRSVEIPFQPDLIVTNPPFSLVLDKLGYHDSILERCLEQWPQATTVMLLRLCFLAAQERKFFWAAYRPSALVTITKRPRFSGSSGTDKWDYGWFIWSHLEQIKGFYWV